MVVVAVVVATSPVVFQECSFKRCFAVKNCTKCSLLVLDVCIFHGNERRANTYRGVCFEV